MPERKKVREYRDTLHKMARGEAQDETTVKKLEGKAAKLGVEIYGEERKGKPRTKVTGRPRR
jgi:hypothetical protein